jgi:hypothetical protein
MKHLYKVPNTNKYVQKKFVRIGEGSIMYSIGRHRFVELARRFPNQRHEMTLVLIWQMTRGKQRRIEELARGIRILMLKKFTMQLCCWFRIL